MLSLEAQCNISYSHGAIRIILSSAVPMFWQSINTEASFFYYWCNFLLALYLYRVGQKIGPFLNVDNFAMVGGRKACYMSKVCKFCLEKYKTCTAVCLNILCLICINIHYPWNYAEFGNNAYFNEFSLSTQWNNSDRLHTWLVQTKFNMSTLDLDNHQQSFWQLIDRSI